MKQDKPIINYNKTLEQVKGLIHKARYQALKAVNKELIQLDWNIGKIIVEKQKKEGWGKSTVEKLAKDIQIEFVGIRGFSSQNIRRMKYFYEIYHNNPKCSALLSKITWTHHLQILKCKTQEEKEFYIKNTVKFGWSYRFLERQIKTNLFLQARNNQTNFDKILPTPQKEFAKLNVK